MDRRGAPRRHALPLDTPLWRALESWVERIEPGARLAPIVRAGFTDSHYLRSLGSTAYGFFPLRAMERRTPRASSTPPTSGSRSTTSKLGVDLFRHVATTLGA